LENRSTAKFIAGFVQDSDMSSTGTGAIEKEDGPASTSKTTTNKSKKECHTSTSPSTQKEYP
jgi:hypothetical protein